MEVRDKLLPTQAPDSVRMLSRREPPGNRTTYPPFVQPVAQSRIDYAVPSPDVRSVVMLSAFTVETSSGLIAVSI